MTQLKLRTVTLKDYKQIDALRENEKPVPFLTDAFTHIWDLTYDIVPRAMLAVEVGSELAGIAGYAMAETDPDLWFMGLIIKPEYRRQGLGRQVYGMLLDKLRPRSARRILTMINTHQRAGRQFLARCGFEEIGRTIYGQLDVAKADTGAWDDPEKIVACQNLHFTTLNRFPRQGLAERLLPIWNRTRPDQPQCWPYVPFSLRRLERKIMESEIIAWQHSFVLVTAEQRIVGLNLNIHDAENRLFTFFTGVDPDFRRRKLGLAFKLKLIAHAQAQGIDLLAAENEAGQAAMWRINQRLGFCRLLELVVYQKMLAA
jgi:GNAT superfamily N-acetyltransferase